MSDKLDEFYKEAEKLKQDSYVVEGIAGEYDGEQGYMFGVRVNDDGSQDAIIYFCKDIKYLPIDKFRYFSKKRDAALLQQALDNPEGS